MSTNKRAEGASYTPSLKTRARSWVLEARRTAVSTKLVERLAHATHRQILHCYGDSHAVVFRYISRKRLLPRTVLDVLDIRGTSAFGLANPTSVTRARTRFLRAIEKVPLTQPLLFCVGEIDCGSLAWRRSSDAGTTPDAELKRSIASYIEFLSLLRDAGHERLIVVAVPYPVVEHYEFPERAAVTASLEERIALTRTFNAELADWCKGTSLDFLSYDDVLDPVTGRVRPEFHHRDPRDWHYSTAAWGPLLANSLRQRGFS